MKSFFVCITFLEFVVSGLPPTTKDIYIYIYLPPWYLVRLYCARESYFKGMNVCLELDSMQTTEWPQEQLNLN